MTEKLSVIIGRFQSPRLTEGHKNLIDHAIRSGDSLLILIGTTAAIGTDKNPLDYKTRKQLIDGTLRGNCYQIEELKDQKSDKDWSQEIDSIVERLGFEDATIFGGRDNNIENYYCGKYKIEIIEQIGRSSATELRKEAGKNPIDSEDFRSGIIYHTQKRYPIVYSTVDIAIYRLNEWGNLDSILMGKKGDKFCFIGGFVDPADEDLLIAAQRELMEESGIYCALEYEFSKKVEDERYRGTKDCVMTHFFSATGNGIEPDYSNICDKEFKEFVWMPAIEKSLDQINAPHKELFLKFINLKK